MSFTDVNEHTKKIISKKHEKSMNKLSATTMDRSAINLEKTLSVGLADSNLNQENKNKLKNNLSFSKEIENLKNNHKARLIRNSKPVEDTSTNKVENLNISINCEDNEVVSVPSISNEAMQLINALMHTQNHIVKEITEVFDKRFEKFDDIIVDLIRCKTENERLKQKNDNLTRDNYRYKKEIECFKPVMPGLYIKKELNKTKF